METLQKNKQMTKQKKAQFRQEETAISNMHSIGNRTYKRSKDRYKSKKRNVYSIKSADQIESDRREALSRISSQIPDRNISNRT